MKKQGLPILLILMMLITPIASAFDHCVGMDMSGHSSESQNLFVTPLADEDTIPLDHQKMLKQSPNTKQGMDCHSSSTCTIHVCGAYTTTSSAPIINILFSFNYSMIENTPLYSTDLTADFRPPISIL